MESLKAFFTKRPEHLSGRCGMLFLMALFVMNSSSYNDGFIEDDGGEVIPPEEIVILPAYMLLDGSYKSGVTLTRNEDSSYTTETTNGDPWATADLLKEDIPGECDVLEFECQTEVGMSNLELFFADTKNGIDTTHGMSAGTVPASTEWASFSIHLKKYRQRFDWGKVKDCLRLDFRDQPNNIIQVRNIRLRIMNDEGGQAEEDESNEALNKERYEQGIKDYLSKEYNCHVTGMVVGESTINIQGNYTGEGTFFLGEVPPFVDMFKVEKVENKTPLSNGSPSVQSDRYVTVDDYEYDRLLSKQAIYKEGVSGDEVVSYARYTNVDKTHMKQSVEAIPLKSKKGLGGLINHGFLTSDSDNLGIAGATISIPISHFTHPSQQEGDIPHTYDGRTYYFNEGYMKSPLDAVLAQASERGVSVASILLVPPTGDAGTLLKHPDFNDVAPYTMPNMITIESTNCYAATLDFLAERYSDPNVRIAHWIMHNEVDEGNHWTSMGDKPIVTFMDTYLRSMRMCYNIARQYDQHSEAFISFSYGWNIAAGGGWYKVRGILDSMNQFSENEGDFFWSLTCHSCPAQLDNPCTQDDEQATYFMNAGYMTLKNLEVSDKWVGLSSSKYKETVRRSAWLSEARACPSSYSDNDLRDQTAGFAYDWKKINNLSGIDGIQWYSWFDHLGDDVCLGLRKYAEAPHNGEAKLVWTTYQEADTDEEDDYFEQYLSRIGTDSWEGIIQDIP